MPLKEFHMYFSKLLWKFNGLHVKYYKNSFRLVILYTHQTIL